MIIYGNVLGGEMRDNDEGLRIVLIAEKTKIRKALDTLSRNTATEFTGPADLVDAAQNSIEAYNAFANRVCLEKKYNEIEEALSRMDESTYRICRRCGFLIDPARLQAQPSTTLCLKCKQEVEGSQIKYKKPINH